LGPPGQAAVGSPHGAAHAKESAPPSSARPDPSRVRLLAQEREAKAERARREAALDAARRHVDALEEEARGGRAAAREAETEAARAQDAASRARRKADEIEARLQKAREALRALK